MTLRSGFSFSQKNAEIKRSYTYRTRFPTNQSLSQIVSLGVRALGYVLWIQFYLKTASHQFCESPVKTRDRTSRYDLKPRPM